MVRVKAIGLAWHDGRLLVAEVREDSGRLKGVRPLGGVIEFGERWRDALVREFAEELSLAVEVVGDPIVLENIFTHEAALGHEIVFAAEVRLPPDSIQGQRAIAFAEDDGRWFDVAELDVPGGPALYPDGLKAHLEACRCPALYPDGLKAHLEACR